MEVLVLVLDGGVVGRRGELLRGLLRGLHGGISHLLPGRSRLRLRGREGDVTDVTGDVNEAFLDVRRSYLRYVYSYVYRQIDTLRIVRSSSHRCGGRVGCIHVDPLIWRKKLTANHLHIHTRD